MVFEEAASHKPLSSATWTDRSALVPKVPAHTEESPSAAQTHRLPKPVSDVSPVPCPKERVKYNSCFESEDCSLEPCFKILTYMYFNFFEARIKF